jgi:hypothetical protein
MTPQPETLSQMAEEQHVSISVFQKPSLYQGTSNQLCIRALQPALYQGTTLVVPQKQQNEDGALAPEGL